MLQIASACTSADLQPRPGQQESGDPTELALLGVAAAHGLDVSLATREAHRRGVFRFDPRLKLMSTVDEHDGALDISVKGAPEAVLARCTRIHDARGGRPVTDADREQVLQMMRDYAGQGLRVLAVAHRRLPGSPVLPAQREDAEQQLCLAGLVAMLDPPRPEVPAAIGQAHRAGIRVHVVTGDNGLTAAAVARRVGIGRGGLMRRCARSGSSATVCCWPASAWPWPSRRSSSTCR